QRCSTLFPYPTLFRSTLCDLVADHRAATPSAAAEAATPEWSDVAAGLTHLGERLARGLGLRATRVAQRIDRTLDRLGGALTTRLDRKSTRLNSSHQII